MHGDILARFRVAFFQVVYTCGVCMCMYKYIMYLCPCTCTWRMCILCMSAPTVVSWTWIVLLYFSWLLFITLVTVDYYSYQQACSSVKVGLRKLEELEVSVHRPEDYFAEMVKTDDHMRKVNWLHKSCQPMSTIYTCTHTYVWHCVCTFVGCCLATIVFIGKLPATGGVWVIIE